MEPHVSLAISKLKSDQRGNVEPGIYEIDEVVHIKGTLRVDEDYTRKTIMSLPHTEILALALHLAGVQQDNAIGFIRSAVTQILTNSSSAVGEIRKLKPVIEEEIKRIKEEIVDRLPEQHCKGDVSFNATVVEMSSGNSTVDTANNILKELMGEVK